MGFVQPNDIAADSLDFARAVHFPAYPGGGSNEDLGGVLDEPPGFLADAETGTEGVPNQFFTLPPRVP